MRDLRPGQPHRTFIGVCDDQAAPLRIHGSVAASSGSASGGPSSTRCCSSSLVRLESSGAHDLSKERARPTKTSVVQSDYPTLSMDGLSTSAFNSPIQ